MHNFRRALRDVLQFRGIVIGILLSSLGVAVFWGANLGTVYPIVDVVLKGRSLREWVDQNIVDATESAAALKQEAALLETQLSTCPPNESGRVRSALVKVRARQSADAEALHLYTAMKPWIDRYLPDRPFPTLAVVIFALLVGSVLKSIAIIINYVLVEKAALLVAFQHRKRLYRRTLQMDLSRLRDSSTSNLLTHFTHDIECLTAGIQTILGRAIREPAKIIACLIGAAYISWRLLFLCLVVTPLAVYLVDRLAKSVKRASRRALDEMTMLYERLSESLSGIELVKAYTMERFERRRFHQVAKQYMKKAERIALYRALNKPINEIFSVAILACALLTGGYLVLNEEIYLFGFLKMTNRPMNFGSLMTFFALLAGISDPFRKLTDVYNEIQRAVAASDRIYRVIDRRSGVSDPNSPMNVQPLESLGFNEVTFGYSSEEPVLNGLQLQIEQGETIAVVGPNGCGKSTLAKLIPRFYDPQEGSISWNGTDIRQFRRRDLRKRIGLVTQRTLLFNDTVYNNILYGSPNATRDQIEEAARRAHAHELIVNDLPDGYDTVVGQGGSNLSGGQRQRIAMARALLCDPELLILDEATSQVDLESERLIRESLAEFTRNRTALVITHRLETLSICDRVVVMKEGQIVDSGTHERLMESCPLYRRLHHLQFKIPA